MARGQKAKRPKPKTVLRLPDLEQWKNAVLNSLAAAYSGDADHSFRFDGDHYSE